MISLELATEIADRVVQTGLGEVVVAELRQAYPAVHFTYCMDDDVQGPEPFLSRPGLNLYLVDGREHCLKLTGHPEAATGLVLAEVLED
jgi:hypothetical protein